MTDNDPFFDPYFIGAIGTARNAIDVAAAARENAAHQEARADAATLEAERQASIADEAHRRALRAEKELEKTKNSLKLLEKAAADNEGLIARLNQSNDELKKSMLRKEAKAATEVFSRDVQLAIYKELLRCFIKDQITPTAEDTDPLIINGMNVTELMNEIVSEKLKTKPDKQTVAEDAGWQVIETLQAFMQAPPDDAH